MGSKVRVIKEWLDQGVRSDEELLNIIAKALGQWVSSEVLFSSVMHPAHQWQMPEKPAPWNGDRASTCTKDTMFNIYRLKYKQQSSYSLIVFYLSLDLSTCTKVLT